MMFVKATKCFRMAMILISFLFALTSIILICHVDPYSYNKKNLKATTGLVFLLWSVVFVLMILQALKMTVCLKKCPILLFGFYFFICGCMFYVQVQIWSGTDHRARNKHIPALYWWLVINLAMFYFIVSFGLATWGAYICKVADK